MEKGGERSGKEDWIVMGVWVWVGGLWEEMEIGHGNGGGGDSDGLNFVGSVGDQFTRPTLRENKINVYTGSGGCLQLAFESLPVGAQLDLIVSTPIVVRVPISCLRVGILTHIARARNGRM
jgi:hypothetical protein